MCASQRVEGFLTDIPRLAQQHGVKFVAGPLVLDAEHEALAVVEAAGPEVIHSFVNESGLIALHGSGTQSG